LVIQRRWRCTILTKALVAGIEVPEVNAEVISRYVSLLIRIDGDGMDVVGMGVGVNLSGDGSDDVVLLYHPRKLEMASVGRRDDLALAIEMVGF
jgi:hypothetical protein